MAIFATFWKPKTNLPSEDTAKLGATREILKFDPSAKIIGVAVYAM